ncbi:MAG: hypothetical protein LBD03_00650, partial [Methanobrevibacter sp.]|nr:hypothetical protein [Candidatus Methanovirga procula]
PDLLNPFSKVAIIVIFIRVWGDHLRNVLFRILYSHETYYLNSGYQYKPLHFFGLYEALNIDYQHQFSGHTILFFVLFL